MTTDERVEKLEQRLTVLEGLVRQLLGQMPIRKTAERRDGGTARRAGSKAGCAGGRTARSRPGC